MCLNVILPNLCLAFSSVTFYQIARILLTPTVATMNFFLYGATLPQKAIIALVPTCLGVGMVSYYDSLPAEYEGIKTTSSLGIIFAFTGIFASSLYTIWIGSYHRKLQLNSMQLLHNQAPVACFLLLYGIPFIDVFPEWSTVPFNTWLMIVLVMITRSGGDSLLANIDTVWCLCRSHQHLSIFHCGSDGTSYQHSGRAS
jgi:solute carrier family 35, member E3